MMAVSAKVGRLGSESARETLPVASLCSRTAPANEAPYQQKLY